MNRDTVKKVISDIRTINQVLSPERQASIKLQDVRDGFTITIDGNYYNVTEKNGYADSNEEWFELKLKSLQTGATSFLEWQYDDVMELTLFTSFPKFRELGLEKSDMIKFEDSDSGSFFFDNVEYFYEEGGAAQFFKNLSLQSEEHDYWTFLSGDQSRVISVECWDGDYEVSVGSPIQESQITFVAQK